jgi:hypothetical protein
MEGKMQPGKATVALEILRQQGIPTYTLNGSAEWAVIPLKVEVLDERVRFLGRDEPEEIVPVRKNTNRWIQPRRNGGGSWEGIQWEGYVRFFPQNVNPEGNGDTTLTDPMAMTMEAIGVKTRWLFSPPFRLSFVLVNGEIYVTDLETSVAEE